MSLATWEKFHRKIKSERQYFLLFTVLSVCLRDSPLLPRSTQGAVDLRNRGQDGFFPLKIRKMSATSWGWVEEGDLGCDLSSSAWRPEAFCHISYCFFSQSHRACAHVAPIGLNYTESDAFKMSHCIVLVFTLVLFFFFKSDLYNYQFYIYSYWLFILY